MATNAPIYPIGIQDFETLRLRNNLYVDKTDLIYQLVSTNTIYFLSRPPRFGKSLLISTLEAYFLGKRELFDGLAITALEEEWTTYPVLHIDFSMRKYLTAEALRELLDDQLSEWEQLYGSSPTEKSYATRFKGIIRRACQQTGRHEPSSPPSPTTWRTKQRSTTRRYSTSSSASWVSTSKPKSRVPSAGQT